MNGVTDGVWRTESIQATDTHDIQTPDRRTESEREGSTPP